MYPGRFEEHPMPLMVTMFRGSICSSITAFCSAARTPKSPHPGHQSGSALPFNSGSVICFKPVVVVAISPSSDHDFVHRNRQLGSPAHLFFDRLDNVMRHERFAVVLADIAVRHKAGLAPQVARELPAEIILDDDGAPGVRALPAERDQLCA